MNQTWIVIDGVTLRLSAINGVRYGAPRGIPEMGVAPVSVEVIIGEKWVQVFWSLKHDRAESFFRDLMAALDRPEGVKP